MYVLDELQLDCGGTPRRIQVCQGDLATGGDVEPVDLLFVSAFPGDYAPTPGSLIGALDRAGVSLRELARHKARDLRESCGCWLSGPLDEDAVALGFRRILCFEPTSSGTPAEVVADVFQTLISVVRENDIQSVAMPALATGDQGISLATMLPPLVEAAIQWMQVGFPVRWIRIVERDPVKASEMKGAFGVLKRQYELKQEGRRPYDVFLSYSHKDREEAEFVASCLRKAQPQARFFIDRLVLKPGATWHQEIVEALDACRVVVPLLTPSYVASRICKQEYGIAYFRDVHEEGRLLRPLLLAETHLPPHMKQHQYEDCRERDRNRIEDACRRLL